MSDAMRDYPIVANLGKENVAIIGRIKVPEGIADKLANDTLSLGLKAKGRELERKLIHLTVEHRPRVVKDDKKVKEFREFFRKATELLRGEFWNESEVPDIILKKLQLLKEWNRLKAEQEREGGTT
jgi:hypothetical protein